MRALTFRKRERLVSQRLIDELFGGGNSRSLAAYPLRAVYLQKERQDHHTSLQLLISVPKKRFHHAVDRNRVKRQLREAYRHHKHILFDELNDHPETALLLSFIWMEGRHLDSNHVDSRMHLLLQRIAEHLHSKL